MGSLTLTPAYGRNYESFKQAKRDWDANKDFSTVLGYCNREQIPDLIKDGYNILVFRTKDNHILGTIQLDVE